MRLLSLLLFIVAVILELYCIHLIMLVHVGVLVFFAHCTASVLIGFAGQMFLRFYMDYVGWGFYCFLLLMSLFVPIWGMCLDLFVVITLFRFRKQYFKHAEILDNRINVQLLQPVKSKYGAGGVIRSLLDITGSTKKRTQALLVLGESRFADINKIMYQLLSDDTDEIRLLAFNILEQQERFITDDINRLLSLLLKKKNNNSVELCAKLEKNLALLYWELAYRYLIFRELEQSILVSAKDYAESALKVLDTDATLWVLLGKIYTRLNETEKAQEAFRKTIDYNVPPSQVFPYLAEIKYNEKDYSAVKQYLKSSALLDVAAVASVKKFWDLP